MVTSPDTYPIWRTRRPVVVVLTDPKKKASASTAAGADGGMDAEDDDNDEEEAAGVYHHHYRYLVVTPGADIDTAHGLPKNKLFESEDGSMDEIRDMLTKTKISHGSLMNLGAEEHPNYGTTSDDFGSSFPVTLWENPFLESSSSSSDDNAVMRDAYSSSREFSMHSSSAGALSIYSEATSIWHRGGGGAAMADPDAVLANLPYRTLDIDVATASVSRALPFSSSERMDDGSAPSSLEYTSDGILIDNWNATDDVTFRPYRVREGLAQARTEGQDAEMASEPSATTVDEDIAMASEEKTEEPPPLPRRRIVIVCYHLPVIVSKHPATGEWQASWSESILAKTVGSSFVSSYDAHWVGTVTTRSPVADDADRNALKSLLGSMDCTVLFFDDDLRDRHYRGFCKQVLWLAFHHVDLFDMRNPAFSLDLDAASSSSKSKDGAEAAAAAGETATTTGTLYDLRNSWDQRQVGPWWEAFNIVNRTFAVEVAKMVTPEDVVWVHDYHLSLLPRMLGDEEKKLRGPSARLTKKIFFLHIPFPVSMIFKEMECGPDILEGILHSDVVGFHGFTEARHFLSCAKRILGLSHDSLEGGLIGVKYQKRTVVVTMSSVSIEPYMIDAVVQLPSTIDGEAALRSKHAGRMIIAGLDVAQYLSGVGLKLSAYEKFLEDNSSWRDSLVLVQRCLIPGARQLDEARTIREIRMLVKRITSKYGDAVIDYEEIYGSTLPIDQRLALWKASDCLLNTEVRCGLNLWPLEYVYAQKESDRPGIVVASEFSAVFGVLNGALRISPFAMEDTLATIDKALTMSKPEREGRYLRDIDFISTFSSAQWIQNVLRDLQDQMIDEQRNDGSEASSSGNQNTAEYLGSVRDEQFTRLDPKSILSAYNSTSRRVIILDFNGTIVIKQAVDSFLKLDGSAGDAPPRAVCQSLEKLCADPQNTVFVVSGDIHESLEKAVGNIRGLGLAASNGSCFSPPMMEGESTRTWFALDLGVDWDSVKNVAIPIMSKFTARTNGSFIKIAHSSIGWSYYSCDPEFGSLQAKYLVVELERALGAYDVRFVNLKGIVEVIPRRLNKGIIVKKILRDVAARDNNAGVDFVLCMGDDISDEKMFTSVFSFVSEMDDDYVNVTPSPQVSQLSRGTLLPASKSYLVEPQSVRCRNLAAPMFAFTVAVGKKPSHASQFVDGAESVADLLVKMASGTTDAYFTMEKGGGRHLSRFSSDLAESDE
eukprot:CAMPEP_0183718280 /NCGR_PEP_ID=MMETSP0737-20130205/11582_1 /TAXON_ID=385413 /ORGANISM="Thalassiosira miniscula, Strain CCMP1093" /LENGTH=1219 /DNA_ID=CAMNT_0025947815 /DNA_START=1 /DNA_END=3660 /DNA_ORIENTATION=-